MSAVINNHLKIHETKEGFAHKKEGKMPLDLVAETMEQHFDRVVELIHAASNMRGIRAGALAAFLDYSLKYDHFYALELLNQVTSGENLTKNMPAYCLRAFSLENQLHSTYGFARQLVDCRATDTACLANYPYQNIQALPPSMSWDNIKMRPSNYPKLWADKDGKPIKKVG